MAKYGGAVGNTFRLTRIELCRAEIGLFEHIFLALSLNPLPL